KTKLKSILLGWSEHVSSSDVQDPLGLSLRGSARLGSRLLHGIISITPRARYFSFIPWCCFDYQNRDKGKSHALGVRDATLLRENALTLACVTHDRCDQDGTCKGGAFVSNREAKRWLCRGDTCTSAPTSRRARGPGVPTETWTWGGSGGWRRRNALLSSRL